ncbi:MAG: hypothetical protein PVG78_15905, partial [Desulfobacterales bacterium]
MKRFCVLLLTLGLMVAGENPASAGSARMAYGWAPGQVWTAALSSQSETAFMGKKDLHRSKTVIEYRVTKGPKNNWVSLAARIVSQQTPGAQGGGQMDLSGITFYADMHRSGELRNIRFEGSALPPGAEDMPAQMKAMMAESSKMIADAWKPAVFWFPELPEEALSPGDEFEVQRKMGMGSAAMGMQSQTVSKQVFTLEEISAGLAYFTVRERSVTRTEGLAGGRADTKTASRGETVFDLKTGMWVDMVVKSKSNVGMTGMAGMGDSNQDVANVSK